jgi:LEA14-like dessication related protein
MTSFRVLALPLLLTACEGGSYLPTVAFERLDLRSISWEDVDSDFVFSVHNPNPIDIDLARFDYALSFVGIEWVSGDNPDGLELLAEGTSEWALPMHIVFQDLYDLVQATKGEDTIPFEIQGSFGFDTTIGDIDLPYNADGNFPALRTPKVEFSRLQVKEIGFDTAELELDLDITNEHGTNLWFKNFDYDVDLSGYDIGTGDVPELGEALAATESTLALPLSVDLFEAGGAVIDILTGNEADLDLVATTDVDTPFGVVPLSIDEHGNIEIQ